MFEQPSSSSPPLQTYVQIFHSFNEINQHGTTLAVKDDKFSGRSSAPGGGGGGGGGGGDVRTRRSGGGGGKRIDVHPVAPVIDTKTAFEKVNSNNNNNNM